MSEEIIIEHNGVVTKAEYSVCEDTLSVYLPNGEVRTTDLRGLKPRIAALIHLKSYVNSIG